MPKECSVKGYQLLEITFVSQNQLKAILRSLVPLCLVCISASALIVLYSELSLYVHSSLRTRSSWEEGVTSCPCSSGIGAVPARSGCLLSVGCLNG